MTTFYGFAYRLVNAPLADDDITVELRGSSEPPIAYLWPDPATGDPQVIIQDINTRDVLSISTSTTDPVEINAGSGNNPVLVFKESDLSP